jgi:hypothetical protein
MHEVDWHNPPQRLLVLWLTGEVEFETSDENIRRLPAGSVVLAEDTTGKGHIPVTLPRASWWGMWPSPNINADHAVGASAIGTKWLNRNVCCDVCFVRLTGSDDHFGRGPSPTHIRRGILLGSTRPRLQHRISATPRLIVDQTHASPSVSHDFVLGVQW